YINKRPPGFFKVPDQPVIILTADEEAEVRKEFYGVTELWKKMRQKADEILIRHSHFSRVNICAASGEVIRSVKREGRGTPQSEGRKRGKPAAFVFMQNGNQLCRARLIRCLFDCKV